MTSGSAEGERLSIHGIELEVLRRGTGRPILVLHGFDTIDPAASFLDLLGRHGEIIAPSSPGSRFWRIEVAGHHDRESVV